MNPRLLPGPLRQQQLRVIRRPAPQRTRIDRPPFKTINKQIRPNPIDPPFRDKSNPRQFIVVLLADQCCVPFGLFHLPDKSDQREINADRQRHFEMDNAIRRIAGGADPDLVRMSFVRLKPIRPPPPRRHHDRHHIRVRRRRLQSARMRQSNLRIRRPPLHRGRRRTPTDHRSDPNRQTCTDAMAHP